MIDSDNPQRKAAEDNPHGRKMIFKRIIPLTLAMLFLSTLMGTGIEADILERAPEEPQPGARYVFYLHGKIIEDAGRRPKHKRFGFYEYDAILQALQDRGYVVISEARLPDTRAGAYARNTRKQIELLLEKGVPPDHISVLGFSKGGFIAQVISEELEAPVRYVLMASCSKSGKGRQLHGDILSIRERSDSMAGSCQSLFDQSPDIGRNEELLIASGGGHGAFFRPQAAWLLPLGEWVEK